MTQEEKQLLLKDLCGRLIYEVKAKINLKPRKVIGVCDECVVVKGKTDIETLWNNYGLRIEGYDIKPYLRTMSSITEEEFDEIKRRWVFTEDCHDENDLMDVINRGTIDTFDAYSFVDWLNAHHFDYRGLIEKGLALEAPKDMYTKIK